MDKEMFLFYRNALTNNLCAEYKGYWQRAGEDKEKLIELSLIQQSIPYVASYCYNDKGVSKDYLLKQYSEYINGRTLYDCDGVHGYSYQLYVDCEADILDLKADVSHFMWCEGLTIQVEETKCPTIYISNKSDLTLVLCGNNAVRVYMFDESKLTIEDCDEESSIVIYKYSDDCKVDIGKYCLCEDKIKQHNKTLRL